VVKLQENTPGFSIHRDMGEVGEDGLRDLLGQRKVASATAQGGGVNQIHMPAHEFREGAFRAAFNVVVQQSIAVGGHGHLHSIEAAVPQKRTRNFSM
jgi:hypothetical protein